MGWNCYSQLTKKEVKEIIYDQMNSDFIILDHRYKGNEYWFLVKNDKNQVFILLELIKVFENEYASKILTESEGPYYYNVPLKWFTKTNHLENSEWRAKVKKHYYYIAKQKTILETSKPGDKIYLIDRNIPYVIYERKHKRSHLGCYDNKLYSIPKDAVLV